MAECFRLGDIVKAKVVGLFFLPSNSRVCYGGNGAEEDVREKRTQWGRRSVSMTDLL